MRCRQNEIRGSGGGMKGISMGGGERVPGATKKIIQKECSNTRKEKEIYVVQVGVPAS
jgi:hypothetical protein